MTTNDGNSSEWGLLVAFPDDSNSFCYGFEAGMLFQRMKGGEELIQPSIGVRVENREVVDRMALAMNYDTEWHDLGEAGFDEWIGVRLNKQGRPKARLTVIEGGLSEIRLNAEGEA